MDFSAILICLKWPYLCHFESDWCQILNLSLICLKHLQYRFLKFWRPSWILAAILDFLKWPYLSHFESDCCKILNLNLVCLRHLLEDQASISDIVDSAPPTSHLHNFNQWEAQSNRSGLYYRYRWQCPTYFAFARFLILEQCLFSQPPQHLCLRKS